MALKLNPSPGTVSGTSIKPQPSIAWFPPGGNRDIIDDFNRAYEHHQDRQRQIEAESKPPAPPSLTIPDGVHIYNHLGRNIFYSTPEDLITEIRRLDEISRVEKREDESFARLAAGMRSAGFNISSLSGGSTSGTSLPPGSPVIPDEESTDVLGILRLFALIARLFR